MKTDRPEPAGRRMSHLVRRFVCGRCGATAPLSTRPYQECASCNAVSDYDFGVARQHPDWPAHEALVNHMFAQHQGALGEALAAADRARYAEVYAGFLGPVIAKFPALYPTGAKDPAYRARLTAFHAAWQAMTAVDRGLVEQNTLFAYRRQQVDVRRGRAVPASLWPLIDLGRALFDAMQEAADRTPPGPPDDFVPGYVRRFCISGTVAEWLPKLAPAAQRELVERLGVTAEYLEPKDDTLACPNCGGAVPVTRGFLVMPCPYCKAEIQEARAAYRAVEADRADYAEYERSLAEVERRAKQRLVRLQALDGHVTRTGKPYRMLTVRAGFGRGASDVWEMFDVDDSPYFAQLLAWAGACAGDRGVPLERTAYREHPRCNELPDDVAELARRLEETAPGAPVTATVHTDGLVAEAVVDGTVVRLVHDEHGKRTRLIRQWVGR